MSELTMMPTFGEAYRGLFAGKWQDEKGQVLRPEDFGLDTIDALVPVCQLCLWHNCDRCVERWEDGPPPLRLILEGEDYYDGLPLPEYRRNEDEEDDTVEVYGDALYIARENRVVFPRAMQWALLAEVDEEVERHPAFKVREVQPMGENKVLAIYCDGGKRSDGTTYGSVKIGSRIWRREFGLGTNNEAEYKALVNGLYLARKIVERNGMHVDLIEFRLDSELVRNQMIGAYRVKSPALQALHERAWNELNLLLRAMRKGPNDLARVRFVHIPEAQMKRVLGH